MIPVAYRTDRPLTDSPSRSKKMRKNPHQHQNRRERRGQRHRAAAWPPTDAPISPAVAAATAKVAKPHSQPPRSLAPRFETPASRLPIAIAAVTYSFVIWIVWGYYGLHSGMGYETGFSYNSMTNTWWNGFLYLGDPLRIHTSTFYHLSYLIAKMIGISGSYTPFQVVYAILWWARGFLCFLILRRFYPRTPVIGYLSGAFVLIHAADGALQWVGQMNQFGFIFWMLLAFYFFVIAYQASNLLRSTVAMLAACGFESMSLFSYESQLLLILAFPIAVLALGRRWQRYIPLAASWYVVPAVYAYLSLKKYQHSGGSTYQEGVMRKHWGVASIGSDWWFNIVSSLKFWSWPRSGALYTGPALLAAALVLVGGMTLLLLARNRGGSWFGPSRRALWILLTAGLVGVVLSFPVYLLLDSARGLWRTQFLSGIGAALVFTAILALIVDHLPWRTARTAAFILGCGSLIYCGSLAAIGLGAFHRGLWERHRRAISEVLHVAPSVRPDSVIVLTNVPKNADPFGDDMWYDLALRLVYPGIRVAGVYYYADGTRPPGDALMPAGNRWTWDHVTGFPPLVEDASLANTIVVRYDANGSGALETSLPPYMCKQACSIGLYNPSAVITGPVDPSAVRRYRLNAPD